MLVVVVVDRGSACVWVCVVAVVVAVAAAAVVLSEVGLFLARMMEEWPDAIPFSAFGAQTDRLWYCPRGQGR